jgi:xanthine dehydrogenase large subunit
MLAISVREALRDAVAAFGPVTVVTFDSPATPERIFFAIRDARRQASSTPAAPTIAVRRGP